MEFNDSTVRDFQLSKLKEECFGGDSSGSGFGGFGLSSFDGWGLGGGGYGKSGYMLFYERREKKPLKLLAKDGIVAQTKEEKEEVKDAKPDEQEADQYIMVDYQAGVIASEPPNRIFQKVLEDNRKFGFENEIYSAEFFDFVLGIQKVVLGLEGDDQTTQSLRRSAFAVGSKATLEVLAKAFNNSCIDEHVAVLV